MIVATLIFYLISTSLIEGGGFDFLSESYNFLGCLVVYVIGELPICCKIYDPGIISRVVYL